MPSEARQKKIVEKLNRAQKCSILGPQNLGSGGGPGPRGPPPGSAPVTDSESKLNILTNLRDFAFVGWEPSWTYYFAKKVHEIKTNLAHRAHNHGEFWVRFYLEKKRV